MNKRFHLNLDPSFQAHPRQVRPSFQYIPVSRPFPLLLTVVAVTTLTFTIGLLL